VRTWSDAEMAAFERRWPIGIKQPRLCSMPGLRALVCTGLLGLRSTSIVCRLYAQAALDKAPGGHVTVINTEFGKPFRSMDSVVSCARCDEGRRPSVYAKEIADALEADLQPLAISGLITRISKYDTNPANNPQSPQPLASGANPSARVSAADER